MISTKPRKCPGLKNPARPCGRTFFGAGLVCVRCRSGKYYGYYKTTEKKALK